LAAIGPNIFYCTSLLLTLSQALTLSQRAIASGSDESDRHHGQNTPAVGLFCSSDLAVPVASWFLPGLGQYGCDQLGEGAIYSSIALAGLAYTANASSDYHADADNRDQLYAKDQSLRKMTLGIQTYMTMGGYSLFSSFQNSTKVAQNSGQYSFLGKDESVQDLLRAPFNFHFLGRPSTLVPLSIITALSLYAVQSHDDTLENDIFTKDDAFYATAYSFNAGTYEEMIFRGWMMPVFHEYWMTDTMANCMQALTFGAMHLNQTKRPVIQAALGWHLGHTAITNHWTLAESIFIHTWWDVIAFTGAYHVKTTSSSSRPLALRLPPIAWYF
jgi:membrane protease YdiL (CAAX protease family)